MWLKARNKAVKASDSQSSRKDGFGVVSIRRVEHQSLVAAATLDAVSLSIAFVAAAASRTNRPLVVVIAELEVS